MGLDVYLYHSDNWEESLRIYNENREREDAIYTDVRETFNIPENRYDFENFEGAREFITGRFEELKDKNQQDNIKQIELDSTINPEHMFKIGYFRSSYNDGGFNHVVNNTIGSSLYEVFENRGESEDDRGYNTIDWEEAKGNIIQLVERLNEFVESPASNYAVQCVHTRNLFAIRQGGPPEERHLNTNGGLHFAISEEMALQHFMEMKELYGNRQGGFSSLSGDYFLGEPLKVAALIKGEHCGSDKCIYVIRCDEGTQENYKWYLEAAKIVEETIDYVLSQPDPENYRVVWSG